MNITVHIFKTANSLGKTDTQPCEVTKCSVFFQTKLRTYKIESKNYFNYVNHKFHTGNYELNTKVQLKITRFHGKHI